MTVLTTRQEPLPVVRIVRGRPQVYLEVILQGKSVRVQPVDSDRGRSLNRFWTVWLRHIVLGMSDARHTYDVELRDDAVIITSSATQEELSHTVAMLAQEIRPIRQAPLDRISRDNTPRTDLAWGYGGEEWGDKEVQTASSLVLPHGAVLDVIDGIPGWSQKLELHCSAACELRTADVGKIVELHFALCLGG